MATKKTSKAFTVNAWLTVCASVTITANSFKEAAEQAEKLQVGDFIEFNGEFMDGRNPSIAWITDDSAEPQ